MSFHEFSKEFNFINKVLVIIIIIYQQQFTQYHSIIFPIFQNMNIDFTLMTSFEKFENFKLINTV